MRAYHPKAAYLLFAAVALLITSNVQACHPHHFDVTLAGVAAFPNTAFANTSYTAEEVAEALEGYASFGGRYLDGAKTTFACVDARGTPTSTPTLKTPGGDIAELAAGIIVVHRMLNQSVTPESINTIFRMFMRDVARPSRPFYFHSAYDKMQYAFKKFYELTGEHVVVLPEQEPTDKAHAEAWYKALVYADAQGCGHLRLMITNYSSYGLTSEESIIIPELIKSFFKFWWPTPEGSRERSKVMFSILQMTLEGKALAIVKNAGPACSGMDPELIPSHGGSTMFIHQPDAVAKLRSVVLSKFFTNVAKTVAPSYSFDKASFLSHLNKLQDTQVGATLQLLYPLNNVEVFSVDVKTDDDHMSRKMLRA